MSGRLKAGRRTYVEDLLSTGTSELSGSCIGITCCRILLVSNCWMFVETVLLCKETFMQGLTARTGPKLLLLRTADILHLPFHL